MTAVTRVTCEYQINPLGVDVRHPRFCYQLRSDESGVAQQAWRIVVSSSPLRLQAGDYDCWDSGWQPGPDTLNLRYEGVKLRPRTAYCYRVFSRLTGGEEVASEPCRFETGLLTRREMAAAVWIGHTVQSSRQTHRSVLEEGLPSPLLRRRFELPQKPVRRARLYTTALGLYRCRLNGSPVGDAVLTPGWTVYDRMLQYQTYDVTAQLGAGENVLAVTLGDGWYAGSIGLAGREYYGGYPLFYYAQLHIEFADGSTAYICTDQEWKASQGAICYSDLFNGEYYDANLQPTGWEQPGFDDSAWEPVYLCPYENAPVRGDLVAQINPPVRVNELLTPVSVTEPAPGCYVLDMGQNMVGWLRARLRGEQGRAIRLRFAEVLNPDGTLYTENLRTAKATDTYVCAGTGEEVFEPSFTFHGFRYVEVSNLGYRPDCSDFTGCVIYSSMPLTGHLSCGHPLVNQLAQNILWGQKGNFIDIPTDCPQRDERLGWTGDTQVFAKTACYNMEMASFYTKTMRDLSFSQRLDGAYPDVAPYVHLANSAKHTANCDAGNPAWAECGIIVPYTVYLCYRDTEIIRSNYAGMQRYMQYLIDDSEDFLRGEIGYGDWLSVGETTSRALVGTAYFAYAASLMAEMSRAIGETAAAERYEALFEQVRSAYLRAFVTEEEQQVRVCSDTQTAYVLTLKMLRPGPALAEKLCARLVEKIAQAGGHITSGFVGISYMLPILSDYGQDSLCYDLLLQTTYPSWGYSIVNGATTIWERWNSYTKENGVADKGMNSFNHYSLGSVGEWLYRYMGGIRPDEAQPGYRHFFISPVVDARLGFADVTYDSISGPIASRWECEGAKRTFRFTVPANTSATVRLPKQAARARAEVAQGTLRLLEETPEAFVYEALSGSYQVCLTPAE